MRCLLHRFSSISVITTSLPLRHQVLLGVRKEVLCQLLADGRAAGGEASRFLVLFDGFLDTFPVEAFMIDELGILGGDDRPLQMNRDILVGHPLLLELACGFFTRSSLRRNSMKRVVPGLTHPQNSTQPSNQKNHRQASPSRTSNSRLNQRAGAFMC
jgi:hypothetical protein